VSGGSGGEILQNVDAGLSATELAQCLCQALVPRQHPIMQLPGLYMALGQSRPEDNDNDGYGEARAGASYSIAPLKAALQLGERELLARFLAGVFPGEGQ